MTQNKTEIKNKYQVLETETEADSEEESSSNKNPAPTKEMKKVFQQAKPKLMDSIAEIMKKLTSIESRQDKMEATTYLTRSDSQDWRRKPEQWLPTQEQMAAWDSQRRAMESQQV